MKLVFDNGNGAIDRGHVLARLIEPYTQHRLLSFNQLIEVERAKPFFRWDMGENHGAELALEVFRATGDVLVAQRLESTLGDIAHEFDTVGGRVVREVRSGRLSRQPAQLPRKLTGGLAGLSAESVGLEEGEVRVLLGVTDKGQDVGQSALTTALIADDRDQVRIERDLASVEPSLAQGTPVDFRQ